MKPSNPPNTCVSTLLIKSESVQDGFIPTISAYSKPREPVLGLALITDINPLAEFSSWSALVGKNILYCDLLLITSEFILCVVISLILFSN